MLTRRAQQRRSLARVVPRRGVVVHGLQEKMAGQGVAAAAVHHGREVLAHAVQKRQDAGNGERPAFAFGGRQSGASISRGGLPAGAAVCLPSTPILLPVRASTDLKMFCVGHATNTPATISTSHCKKSVLTLLLLLLLLLHACSIDTAQQSLTQFHNKTK